VLAAHDPVGEQDGQAGDDHGQHGRHQRGDDHLLDDPVASTARAPSAAKAEPTTPPISACELDEGRPKYQVSRFQPIAPIRPAKTMAGVMSWAVTMPEAIVAATSSERKAPTKFSTPAMPTATRGAIARVEIEVATALAVSWKPFVKSNASAAATTIQRTTSESTTGS
jgi:hypothetical protein